MFREGDVVRFRDVVEEGDERARFVVVEDRGERVLVCALDTGLSIPPTAVYGADELIPADEGS